MLRHGFTIVGSMLAFLLLGNTGWAFPAHRGAFVAPSRGFPTASSFTVARSYGIGNSFRFPSYGFGVNPYVTPFNPNAAASLGAVRTYNPLTRTVSTTTPFGTYLSTYGVAPGAVNGYNPVTRTVFTRTPFGTFASSFSATNPASFVSPFANTALNQSAYLHTLRHYEREAEWGNNYNPYLSGYGYGGYGYGYGMPYGGYGMPSYGIGYGSGTPSTVVTNNGASQPAAPAVPVAANNGANSSQPRPGDALKAFGIPVEFGEVKWPLALRLMPPDTKRDLLDKLESQMKIAANQAIGGAASPTLLRETKSTIDSVKWWLRGRRSNMADSTYQEGDAFLRQLEDSLRRMDS